MVRSKERGRGAGKVEFRMANVREEARGGEERGTGGGDRCQGTGKELGAGLLWSGSELRAAVSGAEPP